MKQLTVRGFDRSLERELRRTAMEQGVSLNGAALHLMRRGAGLDGPPDGPRRIGPGIDRFVGSLSREDATALREAVEQFETIDPSLWR